METQTWLIVGASRGIGLEFVRQLLTSGHRVIATARGPGSALDTIARDAPDRAIILTCDVSKNESIMAWILKYPNRALEMTFDHFAHHLLTNTVGPIIVAQQLLKMASPRIDTIAFMSSDSGSAQRFLAYEDGFAAYAASKAALNQALRHMAEELKRQERDTVILALHPGEVATYALTADSDMGMTEITWELDGGQISAEESVRKLVEVIRSKKLDHTGTFWTWGNEEYPW
ncbi:hypothetical protein LV164_001310 [Aspergillus fumigatus]|nr:hypothetical protein KXW62_008256 [Aspergillus fumigatus]KAJ8165212.1 hypothetical protein LV165_002025 [Aspergillus fumigatus]KAJ8167626.1 hypothetical protein LV162_002344 [Aspergillus fumigatus]KAJ8187306.1 hypothetical protein LV157_004959 [Aspergillus fumigatus]KAJ8214850.1 hypothetical protein LV164_001310 [Aspergillus fumigatus]